MRSRPPLATGSSWTLPDERKLAEYETPRGRRVNALAAYRPYDRAPCFDVCTAEGTRPSYDLLILLGALPRARVPRVVVLDNAGLRTRRSSGRRERACPGAASTCIPAGVQSGTQRN